MKPLGMRILLERDIDREFTFTVPEWIGQRLGELLLMDYDGQKLTIGPVEAESQHSNWDHLDQEPLANGPDRINYS